MTEKRGEEAMEKDAKKNGQDEPKPSPKEGEVRVERCPKPAPAAEARIE